jgi:hypothetical protein
MEMGERYFFEMFVTSQKSSIFNFYDNA